MMTEADFAALNEHLQELRPIFDEFCVRNGFLYAEKQSLGRYPRIRVERLGAIKLWFDLWMELDNDGGRFQQFRPDLPYELAAGAYIDIDDGSKYGIRFQKSFVCFSRKPFNQVASILQNEMQKHLHTLEGWNVHYLKGSGEKVQLGS